MSIFSDFMCRAARDGNLDKVIHLLQVSKNEKKRHKERYHDNVLS